MSASALQDLQARGAYVQMDKLLQLRFAARDLHLAAPRNNQANQRGAQRTRFRGRGMEFEEVRIYQPGDDIRTIDWRVTARTNVPHTKLFREERERPTFIAVDQRSRLFFGSRRCFKSVLAAHMAALLAWAALNNSDRVGGLVFGDHEHRDVRPRRSRHSVMELLQRLAEFNQRLRSPQPPARELSLATVLRDLRRIARPGSSLYLISDFQDMNDPLRGEECRQELSLLGRHTDVQLLQVCDPLEQDLPATGLLSVSDGRQRLQIPADEAQVRQAYHQRWLQDLEALKKNSTALRMSLCSFSTADDEIARLRGIYRLKACPAQRRHRIT